MAGRGTGEGEGDAGGGGGGGGLMNANLNIIRPLVLTVSLLRGRRRGAGPEYIHGGAHKRDRGGGGCRSQSIIIWEQRSGAGIV